MRKSVFIGGASRSGTTMLGAMLGSHSRMVATPESQFKFDIASQFDIAAITSTDIITYLKNHPRFRIWNFEPEEQSLDVSGHGALIRSVVHQYAGWKNKGAADYWIDHTPINLRHSHFLNQHYPDCLFINIIRDGRAVMASQFSLDWGSNDPIFAALKWIEPLCVGMACESAYPDRCLRVYYEKLVLNPEEECKRICKFLGVAYEPDMIKGEGFDVPAFTKANHQLVGKSPSPDRIDNWKKTLKPEDIRIFESMTFDLLPMLGYQKIVQGFQSKPSEIRQAWLLFKGAVQYLTIDRWRMKSRLSKKN